MNVPNPANLAPGAEQFQIYHSAILKRRMVHYDYRDHDGLLFSCLAHSLEEARQKRDRWLKLRAEAA